MPVNPAPGRLRQEGREFKASYVRPCLSSKEKQEKKGKKRKRKAHVGLSAGRVAHQGV